jgi:hypothetical protein
MKLLIISSIYGWILLPFSWVLCTGQLRKIQVVFAHHCVHRTYFHNNAKYNDFMLELLTLLAFVQNGREYRIDHLGHHNRQYFTTKDDADAALLYSLGFLPGLSREKLWKKLFFIIFTPKLHYIFIKSRFMSNIVNRPFKWRVASSLWLLFLLFGTTILVKWWVVVLVLWVPMFILYNISALLQFITEHAWMITDDSPKGDLAYAERCWGRFFGEKMPTNDDRKQFLILRWSVWLLKMLVIHAPIRFACFVGDLPAHDWHHLCTLKDKDPSSWPTAIFSRQEMIDQGCTLMMEKRELWGLKSMLDHVFLLLETAEINKSDKVLAYV